MTDAPEPEVRSAGSDAWVARKAAVRLVSTMLSQLARSHLGHRLADEGPGVVDQDVEAAEPLDGSGAHRPDGGAVAKIGGCGEGPASRCLDGLHGRFGALGAPGMNGDMRALAREGLGDGGADAASRSGNQGAAALKRSLHSGLPAMLLVGVGRWPGRPSNGERTGELRYRLAVMMIGFAESCQR